MTPEAARQFAAARPRAVSLARYLWERVQRFCGRSIGLEDLEQVATWALFRAAQRWRDWYGKPLWQWARRRVRTELLRCIRPAQRGGRLPYHLTEEEQVVVPRLEEQLDARRAWDEVLLDQDETMEAMAERLGYGERRHPWSVPELAQALRVSERRVTKLLKEGAIEGQKVDRRWRIPDHAAVDAVTGRRTRSA